MLAGLAQVLPKNVWQYVVQIPRLASLGRKFVLQGGTQYNLAAVKAQVDYIKERVPNGEVFVHPHTGEAGAIGAAMETLRVVKRKGKSTFIGIDQAIALEYIDEERRGDGLSLLSERVQAHVHRHEDARTAARAATSPASPARRAPSRSKEAMLALVADRKKTAQQFPNMVDYEAKRAFMHFYDAGAAARATARPSRTSRSARASSGSAASRSRARSSAPRRSARQMRRRTRIGIPRVLNLYSTAPFFRTYFEALGIPKQNVVFSDETTEEMWVEGGKYGSIDPCYPSKVAQAHIHNLLFHQHTEKKPLKYIFFPILTHVTNFVTDTMDNASCPIVAGAPDVMKAAFTKEVDFFATRGIEFLDPAVSFVEPNLMAKRHVRDVGPAPRHHRGRERSRLPRGLEGAHDLRERSPGQGPRDPRDRRGRGPRRDPPPRASVPLGPGPEPRHPRGVPGPRLSRSCRSARSRSRASTSIATSRRSSRAGR